MTSCRKSPRVRSQMVLLSPSDEQILFHVHDGSSSWPSTNHFSPFTASRSPSPAVQPQEKVYPPSGRFAVFSYSSEGLAAGTGKFFFARSLAIFSALAVSQVCACSEVRTALTLLTYWSCSSLRFALFSAVVVTASLFTACTAST